MERFSDPGLLALEECSQLHISTFSFAILSRLRPAEHKPNRPCSSLASRRRPRWRATRSPRWRATRSRSEMVPRLRLTRIAHKARACRHQLPRVRSPASALWSTFGSAMGLRMPRTCTRRGYGSSVPRQLLARWAATPHISSSRTVARSSLKRRGSARYASYRAPG